LKEPSKKPAPNLIKFQFVMPVVIKDVFMFTAYTGNDKSAMNMQIFR